MIHDIRNFVVHFCRVIAVDLRGYGDSEKPSSQSAYRIDTITKDVRELVKTLGREKFTLVAHDWGAVIAWNYVLNYMDTVDKYIMMGAPERRVHRKLMTGNWAQFNMSWWVNTLMDK
jgi:pimeloyl-ACP methyl ester carboxylesterase